MYRLGTAELNGHLGLSRRPKEGVKWLKRSAEHATEEFPHALHELALIHEQGIENVVFVDFEYCAELLAQASELGYAPSAFKLGECYEYGRMGCPVDAALSIHYYVSRTGHGEFSRQVAEGIFRISPPRPVTATRALLSPLGTLSARPASCLNQTPKHICGQERQPRWVSQRPNTPWAISPRSVIGDPLWMRY